MAYIWIWNVLVFLLYGADKLAAIKKKERIPEVCLISASLLAGGIGAISAMVICKHKTQKFAFRIAVPVSLIITEAIILFFDRQLLLGYAAQI